MSRFHLMLLSGTLDGAPSAGCPTLTGADGTPWQSVNADPSRPTEGLLGPSNLIVRTTPMQQTRSMPQWRAAALHESDDVVDGNPGGGVARSKASNQDTAGPPGPPASSCADLREPPRADAEAQLARAAARIAQLEYELRSRDEFLATLAHELRNPLTPLFLQARMLRDASQSAPDGKVSSAWLTPRLGAFIQRLDRFLDRLNVLLDLSCVSTNQIRLKLEHVDLSEVVRDSCAALANESRASCCELRLRLGCDAIGRWDRLRLEQICGNLVSNAIHHGAGNPVEVEVVGGARAASVIVRDHGVGISEQDQARLFQPFVRGSSAPQGNGFGVGLWIVHNLCEALGGDIRVSSRLGHGATFTVTLPRDATGGAPV